MANVRNTQNLVEVLYGDSHANVRSTQTLIEVLHGDAHANVRQTQTLLEVLFAVTTTSTTTTTVTTTTVPGSICYGHDTAVEEDNIEDFTGKWEGPGTISGSGDSEKVQFYVGQYKRLIAPHYYGTGQAVVKLNKYQTGDNVSIYYKTAGSPGAIGAAEWSDYSGEFTSQGFVDVLLGRNYDPNITTSTTTSTTTVTTTTITAPIYTVWDRVSAIGGSWGDSTYSSEINYRLKLAAADMSNGGTGTEVRILIQGHGSSSTGIDGVSFGEQNGTTDDYASTPTRFTFSSSNTTTITAGSSKWTDWVAMDIDDTKSFLLHVYQVNRTNYYPYISGTSFRERPGTGDDTMLVTVTGYSDPGYHYFIEEVQIRAIV